MTTQTILRIAALSGAVAVALGAFGAHALKPHLSPEAFSTWQTASQYHFLHTLALLALGLSRNTFPSVHWTALAWITGTLLFSGSLYLLSTRALHSLPVAFLGPVTPLGGLFLILGWLLLIRTKAPSSKE